MSSSTMQRGLNMGLALLCLLGAVMVVLELARWPFFGAIPGSASKANTPAAGERQAPAKTHKSGNPFSRTPLASALPVTSPETGITVYGVIIGQEGSIVLAKAGAEGVKQFKTGQSLGGFRIKEVHADRLVLQKGEDGAIQTIRWLKREDYLTKPRPAPAIPPSQGQISGPDNGGVKQGPAKPGFQIKPSPQEKLGGVSR